MSSIFLAHSSRNKRFTRRLATDLESCHITVWLDEAELGVGDSLILKISEAIKGMEYLGVVLSPSSVASAWVQKEVAIALSGEISGNKVRVLPILCKRCEIPSFLVDKLYVDLSTKSKYQRNLPLLIKTITDWPTRPFDESWALSYVRDMKEQSMKVEAEKGIDFEVRDYRNCLIYLLRRFRRGLPKSVTKLCLDRLEIDYVIPCWVYGRKEMDTEGMILPREVAEHLFRVSVDDTVFLSQTGEKVLELLEEWEIESPLGYLRTGDDLGSHLRDRYK